MAGRAQVPLSIRPDPGYLSPVENSSSRPARSPSQPRKLLRIALGTFVALFLYLSWQALSIHRFGFADDGRDADCAIVLGTAAWHNKPSPVLQERLNHAIGLYESGRVPILILTGGFGDGAEYAESKVAENYCLQRGVPAEALVSEDRSRTTIENLAEARALLEENGLRTALIVSDPWHLKRAVAIARRQGIDAHPSGTTTSRFQSFKARANFLLRELYLYHRYLLLGS